MTLAVLSELIQHHELMFVKMRDEAFSECVSCHMCASSLNPSFFCAAIKKRFTLWLEEIIKIN